ncbi:MAG: hypothetical protein FWG68_07980 [Defluviitaleaceae bacterium]|nr:hypothetical protein [Defluviitaleaceae bacterium]
MREPPKRTYIGITNEELRASLDANIKEIRNYSHRMIAQSKKEQAEMEQRLTKQQIASERRLNKNMHEIRQSTDKSIAEIRQSTKDTEERLNKTVEEIKTDFKELKSDFKSLRWFILGTILVPITIAVVALFLPAIMDNWRNITAPSQEVQAQPPQAPPTTQNEPQTETETPE